MAMFWIRSKWQWKRREGVISMTNNNSALPWRAQDNGPSEWAIIDSDNDVVAYVAAVAGNPRLIETSVNYHNLLKETLSRLCQACESLEFEAGRVDLPMQDAENLLNLLEQLEQNHD